MRRALGTRFGMPPLEGGAPQQGLPSGAGTRGRSRDCIVEDKLRRANEFVKCQRVSRVVGRKHAQE